MTNEASPVPTPDEGWVQEQLRALPQPVMPTSVAAQINAAIRAEQELRIDPAALAGSTPASAPPNGFGRRRGILAGLAVAASVALALMLVAWTPWQSPPDAYERVVALSTLQPVSTDTDYTAANIEQAVTSHLSNLTSRANVVPVASESQRRGSFAANDDVMASCLDGLGTAPADVKLVDLAEFQGQPSGIVVFSDGDGNLVVVVAPRCGRDDPGVRLRVTTTATD